MKNKYDIDLTESILPIPFNYYDKEGMLQTVCFFIPVPLEKGISTFGVDVRKLVEENQCYLIVKKDN